MKSTLKSLTIGIALIGLILLSISFQGCAALKSALQIEPEKVEMVLLSELRFYGTVAGIKVPAQFGDFSVTHDFGGAVYGEHNQTFIDYLPRKNDAMIFALVAKSSCPEPVALSTYNMKTEETTYWIYDSKGQAWKVDEKKFDAFLELDHPCAADMPKGTDAMLSI